MPATYNAYNPIRKIKPQVSGATDMYIYAPSSYECQFYDISSEDAGNNENYEMQKLRIGQKTKIVISYQNISVEKCSELLQAFDYEYIDVTYRDLKRNAYVTKTFYVGDRTAPLYNNRLGIVSKVSFNLIQKGIDNVPYIENPGNPTPI